MQIQNEKDVFVWREKEQQQHQVTLTRNLDNLDVFSPI